MQHTRRSSKRAARGMLAIAAALLASHATAQTPEVIGLHIASHHLSTAPAYVGEWNDNNPGVYARWSNGFTAGTLRNSERRQSAYVGWTFEHPLTRGVTAAITVGGITGYSDPVSPLVAVSASTSLTDRLAARVSWLPKARYDGSHAFHLSVEWSLQ